MLCQQAAAYPFTSQLWVMHGRHFKTVRLHVVIMAQYLILLARFENGFVIPHRVLEAGGEVW